jgi:hypothetical protein
VWIYQPLPAAGVSTAAGGFVAAWAVLADDEIPRTMKKNVASQVVGVQMVAAADGSAFTGAVTVSVTGDGGAQATGSVGSGACTHEGNGYHTYAPAQAETNYDQIGFTFTGTGAIPRSVTVYTTFPQTGDNFALIGATGSGLTSLATQASVNTIDDFLDTEIAAIKTKTDFLPSVTAGDAGGLFIAGTNAATTITTALTTTFTGNLTGSAASVTGAVGSVTGNVGGNVTGSVGSVAAGGITAASFAADAITAAKIAADVTTELQAGLATSAEITTLQTSVTTIDDLLDTEVAAIKTVVDAVKAKTDSLTFTQAGNVDANIQYVNDTAIQGTGAVGTDEWRKV